MIKSSWPKFFLRIWILAILTIMVSACAATPQQTNEELTIWYIENKDVLYRAIIPKFSERYPEVKLNIENIDLDYTDLSVEDAFGQKLAAEVMAGRGPDLIQLSDIASQKSITKMMQAGVFADLTEFYETDSAILSEDYYQPVMDIRCLEGKRYLVPISFKIPLLVTNQNLINQVGIDLNNCTTYDGFMLETTPLLMQWGTDSSALRCFGRSKALSPDLFFNCSRYINLGENRVDINETELKKWMDYYKLVYAQLPEGKSQEEQFWIPGNPIGESYVFEDLSLFPSGDYFVSALQAQKDPILVPLRNEDGSIPAQPSTMFAIRAGSQNKTNAWNFIKLMLESETLSDTSFFLTDIPVSKAATMKRISNCTDLQKEQYISILAKIKADPLPDPSIKFMREAMEPYWKGEKEYEACLATLKEKLTIYVSE